MSDETIKTPGGWTLYPVKRRGIDKVTEWRNDPLQLWMTLGGKFRADFNDGCSADFDTQAEALSWLDDRRAEALHTLLGEGGAYERALGIAREIRARGTA